MNKFKQIYRQKNARKTLLSSMFTMSAIGIIYIWSVFILPLEAQFGWQSSQISMVFTATMFCLSIGIVLSGFIYKRLGSKRLLLGSIAIFATSFAITSLSQTFTTMLVFYGVFCGFLMGVIYAFVIYTCNLWFDKECSGTVSGLLQTCLAGSTVFLAYFASALLEFFDWRIVFRILGVIVVTSLIIALKYLKQPDATQTNTQGKEAPDRANDLPEGLVWQEMLKTRTFRCFWFIRLILLCGGLGMIGHAIPAAMETSANYQNALFSFALFSFFNGISRTLFGIIWDLAGLRKTITLNAFICIAAFSLMFFAPLHKNQMLTILAFALCGMSYGGINLIGIAFTRTVFGLKHFAENYSFSSSPLIIASFIGPYIMAETKTITQSYHYAFLIFMAGGFATLGLMMLMRKINYAEN